MKKQLGIDDLRACLRHIEALQRSLRVVAHIATSALGEPVIRTRAVRGQSQRPRLVAGGKT